MRWPWNRTHEHDWQIIGAQSAKIETSGPFMGGAFPTATSVAWRCRACGHVSTSVLAGAWTIDQLAGPDAKEVVENLLR